MIIRLSRVADLPKKPLRPYAGTPEQAQAKHPGATVYAYAQKPRGMLVLIDTQVEATPDPTDPTPAPN